MTSANCNGHFQVTNVIRIGNDNFVDDDAAVTSGFDNGKAMYVCRVFLFRIIELYFDYCGLRRPGRLNILTFT